MNRYCVIDIYFFEFSQYIDHPFKLFLRSRYPKKIYLYMEYSFTFFFLVLIVIDGNVITFLQPKFKLQLDLKTMSLSIDAKGVTPIPPPTMIAT